MFFQMIDKYSIDFKNYRLKSLHYIYIHDRWDYELAHVYTLQTIQIPLWAQGGFDHMYQSARN